MRRVGPFLLLLEPTGVPFLLIPVWDLLLGERLSPWKVFLFNCSGGVICPNTRLGLQPSEYSQKASLSLEKQGAKGEVAWKMPLEVGEGDCWCDCDWKRASESLRETTRKAFLKCGVHSRMPWALLQLSWFWCDYTDCLVISQHPSWFVCHSHFAFGGWRTSLLSLCCVFSDFLSSAFFVPSIAFCRYLNPWFKRDYNVAKWVEDVNKNTEGPYFRYFINNFISFSNSPSTYKFCSVTGSLSCISQYKFPEVEKGPCFFAAFWSLFLASWASLVLFWMFQMKPFERVAI